MTSRAIAALVREAASAHPRECCGILLGEGNAVTRAVPADNIHPLPETHFEIDPQALVDAHRSARSGGDEVIGYYHSHPNGKAEPSATDRETAAHDGAIWLIVANGAVSGWKDLPDGFAKVSLRVTDA